MNWKVVAPALAAVVLGGAALKIARDSMNKNHAPVQPLQPVARVVMAKGPVLPGQELNGVNIVFGNMPVGQLPADAITDGKGLRERLELYGQKKPYRDPALAPRAPTLPPREVNDDRARLHRTDGSIVYGLLTAFDPTAKEFTVRDGATETRGGARENEPGACARG